MHNLEGISFEEVINEEGISYATYRKTLHPNFTKAWLIICAGILSIFIFCFLSWICESRFPGQSWFFIPVFSFIIGFCIAHVNLYIHEAGHFYLHPNKKINDILANIFLGSWTGVDIKVYRKIHWQHHLHLATADDTENSYYHPLSISFIIESLTGIHLFRVITNKNNKQFLGKALVRRSFYMLLVALAINIGIIGTALYLSHWGFALTWIMSMIIFFPFFATMRQISEHRDELALNDKNYYRTNRDKISRIFSNSFLSRLFGSAGFNKHMIHHWDPHLPFTALKKAEEFLLECRQTRNIIVGSRTTYFSIFKKLLFNR